MITTYPHRPISRPVPVRRRSVSRRVARSGHWSSQPLAFLAGVTLVVALCGVGWVGWQAQQRSGALSQEKFAQDGLARVNRELTGKRNQLLARDNILRRAAALGLYPAQAAQLRKIGGL